MDVIILRIESTMDFKVLQKKDANKETEFLQDILDYDFQNLKLSILAQKIKSQTFSRPKPKMLYY